MSLLLKLVNYLVGGGLCATMLLIAGACLHPDQRDYLERQFAKHLFIHLLRRYYNAIRIGVLGVVLAGALSYCGLWLLGLGVGMLCTYGVWMFLTCPIIIFNHRVQGPGVFFNVPSGPGKTSIH